MIKRWLLFLGLYISCVGAIALGLDVRTGVTPTIFSDNSHATLQISEVGMGDFWPDKARLSRRVLPALPKQLVGDLTCNAESWGLEFLSCNIIRSYSEIHLPDYATHLMGKTIQVNAP